MLPNVTQSYKDQT